MENKAILMLDYFRFLIVNYLDAAYSHSEFI